MFRRNANARTKSSAVVLLVALLSSIFFGARYWIARPNRPVRVVVKVAPGFMGLVVLSAELPSNQGTEEVEVRIGPLDGETIPVPRNMLDHWMSIIAKDDKGDSVPVAYAAEDIPERGTVVVVPGIVWDHHTYVIVTDRAHVSEFMRRGEAFGWQHVGPNMSK